METSCVLETIWSRWYSSKVSRTQIRCCLHSGSHRNNTLLIWRVKWTWSSSTKTSLRVSYCVWQISIFASIFFVMSKFADSTFLDLFDSSFTFVSSSFIFFEFPMWLFWLSWLDLQQQKSGEFASSLVPSKFAYFELSWTERNGIITLAWTELYYLSKLRKPPKSRNFAWGTIGQNWEPCSNTIGKLWINIDLHVAKGEQVWIVNTSMKSFQC